MVNRTGRSARVGRSQFKLTKTQAIIIVGVVVAVGAAIVYKSFAGTNAKYVPQQVANLGSLGRAVRVNAGGTAGYTMSAYGAVYPFTIGVGNPVPAQPYINFYQQADVARDFIVTDWSRGLGFVLTKDGAMHWFGREQQIEIEPVTTNNAHKIVMYDDQRGYIVDGSARFIRFALGGASLPPQVGGVIVQPGNDTVRSAIINPGKTGGYLVDNGGGVYSFSIGSGAVPPAIQPKTIWPGSEIGVDIMMANWDTRQGYVIARNGGWYAFNGAPNDYSVKGGAPFNFGTSIRGFHFVPGFAGAEVSDNGTVYVFSLPNFLVAQNNTEIYPTRAFDPGAQLAGGYYRMPTAPNDEYDFYDPNDHRFSFYTQPTPDPSATGFNQRCGRLELLNMIYAVAKQWKTTYGADGSRLNVGDMNAPGHISHKNGVDVDLRVSNLAAANVPNAVAYPYLRQRSIDLAKWLIDNGARLILYDDSAIYSQVNAYGRSKGLNYDVMQYSEEHNDHFHVRIGLRSISGNPLLLPTTNGCP